MQTSQGGTTHHHQYHRVWQHIPGKGERWDFRRLTIPAPWTGRVGMMEFRPLLHGITCGLVLPVHRRHEGRLEKPGGRVAETKGGTGLGGGRWAVGGGGSS